MKWLFWSVLHVECYISFRGVWTFFFFFNLLAFINVVSVFILICDDYFPSYKCALMLHMNKINLKADLQLFIERKRPPTNEISTFV